MFSMVNGLNLGLLVVCHVGYVMVGSTLLLIGET